MKFVYWDDRRELFPDQKAEFALLVASQLPFNLGHRVKFWAENPGKLALALQKALFPPELDYIHVGGPIWQAEVNYDASLEQLAAAGNYDWMISDPSQYWKTLRSGKSHRNFQTVQFGMKQQLTTQQVAEKLKEIGLRPAETHELLAVAAKFSYQFPHSGEILAAGYHWACRYKEHTPMIPYVRSALNSDRFRRSFCWYNDQPGYNKWGFDNKFLATDLD